MNKILLVLSVLVFVGCSTSGSQNTVSVTLKQDVQVRYPDGSEKQKAKDSQISVKDQALLVEKAGHVDVMIVPLNTKSGKAELRLKPIKEFGGPELDKFIDAYVTKLMTKITLVQESLSRSQYNLALQKVKALQVEYPNLVYLQFLEASCLTLMGQNAEAKRVLTRALEDHPDNPEGQRLNRYLSGSR
ncbi:MAG: hypothetical protein HRT45_03915 [Bdellovibrionales bacterium]|nr:hypothetical protein [Bdellovibrionales bacterium]